MRNMNRYFTSTFADRGPYSFYEIMTPDSIDHIWMEHTGQWRVVTYALESDKVY